MARSDKIQEIIETVSRMRRPSDPDLYKRLGLSSAQSGMLYMLTHYPGISMKEIAEHLGISKSAITQTLEVLIAQGLVERKVKPEDKRVAVLKVTPSGKAKLAELKQQKAAGIREALEILSDEELDQLSAIYKKMYANIKEGTPNK